MKKHHRIDREKNPVAYAREKHRERIRNWRPSLELEEATRSKKYKKRTQPINKSS